MTKQPGGGHGDGSWFLEAVGATTPAPTGAEALSELTKENEVVNPSEPAGDEPAPVADDVTDADAEVGPDDAPAHQTAPAPESPVDRSAETAQVTKTTQITISSFDGDPGTANSTFAAPRSAGGVDVVPRSTPTPPPSQAPTPAKVAAATAVIPPAEPPTPRQSAPPPTPPPSDQPDADLAPQVRSGRSFRWPVVALIGLVVVIVGIAAFWLPQATRAEAVAVRQSYYDATVAVRNQLPASQAALDVITNPTSTSDDLNGSIPAIAQLDTLAFDMQDVAAEPLPTVLPLVPKGPIDELEPLQETTSILGQEGDEIAKRLGNAYIYRISIPVLLSPGNLPISAGTETINTISVTLAASLADDARVVAELPDDPTFEEVHAEALATHDRYAVWQQEYLAALTGEDQDGAQALINELDTMRTDLNASNDAALSVARTEMDGRIVSYAVELETHMTVLTDT